MVHTIDGRQECVACDTSAVQPNEGQLVCLTCPPIGINCAVQTEIHVKHGFYMGARAYEALEHGGVNVTSFDVWRCARTAACNGGTRAGNVSCVEGHTGPLCGICLDGYYRGRLRCKSCDAFAGVEGTSTAASLLVIGMGASLMLGLMGLYLVRESLRSAPPEGYKQDQRRARLAAHPSQEARPTTHHFPRMQFLVSLVVQRLSASSALVRIFLGFCQTVGVTRSYQHVAWPIEFKGFLGWLDLFSIDILTLVPAECALGTRLGYGYELIATLTLPVAMLLMLLLLAVTVAPLAGRRCTRRVLHNWPQIWDLAVWLLLLIYPAVVKKTLSVFDCVPYEDMSLLRADPAMFCGVSEWVVWALIASSAAVVYGVGLPLLGWILVRRFGPSPTAASLGGAQGGATDDELKRRRRLVRVLTCHYREDCAYMESVEILRKFLLTGVITVVMPQTRVQLWFGTMVCVSFLMLFLRLQPYKSATCNIVQVASLVQLVFTYVSSLLFYEEDPDAPSSDGEMRDRLQLGWLMVVANCGAMIITAHASLASMRRIARELREDRLKWPDGKPIQLNPPRKPNGYHLFLSHVWRSGQDQVAGIKVALRALVPSCSIFLDVDDLSDISKLEKYVEMSDVVLVFVSSFYLSSDNCRRELAAAIAHAKPIILLLETDPAHGATTSTQLRGEIDRLELSGARPDECRLAWTLLNLLETAQKVGVGASKRVREMTPPIIEWHRERPLKEAALKAIAAHVISFQPQGKQPAIHSPLELRIGNEAPVETLMGLSKVDMDMTAAVATGGGGAAHALDKSVGAGSKARRRPRKWSVDSKDPSTPSPSRASVESSGAGGREAVRTGSKSPTRKESCRRGGGSVNERRRQASVAKAANPSPTYSRTFYLNEAYANFEVSKGVSLLDEIRERLHWLGVGVVTTAAASAEQPVIVLLCPGVFEDMALVRMMHDLLGEDRGAVRRTIGAQLRASFMHSAAHLTVGDALRKVASQSHMSSEPGVGTSASGRQMLLFASTQRPFASYIASCEEHTPALKKLGLFDVAWGKWPTSVYLQQATVLQTLSTVASHHRHHHAAQGGGRSGTRHPSRSRTRFPSRKKAERGQRTVVAQRDAASAGSVVRQEFVVSADDDSGDDEHLLAGVCAAVAITDDGSREQERPLATPACLPPPKELPSMQNKGGASSSSSTARKVLFHDASSYNSTSAADEHADDEGKRIPPSSSRVSFAPLNISDASSLKDHGADDELADNGANEPAAGGLAGSQLDSASARVVGGGANDKKVPETLLVALDQGGSMPDGVHEDKLGIFIPLLEEPKVHERVCYAKEGNHERMLWWSGGRWWMGKRQELGLNRGFIKAESEGIVPPAKGWVVFSAHEKPGKWKPAPALACVPAGTAYEGAMTVASVNPRAAMQTLKSDLSNLGDLPAASFGTRHLFRGKATMPLMAAVHACNVDAVRLCLERGAPVDKPSNGGECLLAFSAKKGDVEMTELLLAAGCGVSDASAGDVLHSSPLHAAAAASSARCVELLLAWGANVDARDRAGATPLILAIQSLAFECVNLLLDAGADANLACKDGRSPLLHCAQEGDAAARLIPLLCEHGADVAAVTEDGEGVVLTAVREGSVAALKALLAAAADAHAPAVDDNGEEYLPIDAVAADASRNSRMSEAANGEQLLELIEAAPALTLGAMAQREQACRTAQEAQRHRTAHFRQKVDNERDARLAAAAELLPGRRKLLQQLPEATRKGSVTRQPTDHGGTDAEAGQQTVHVLEIAGRGVDELQTYPRDSHAVLDVSEDLEEASVYAPISWMKRMSRRVSKPPTAPLRDSHAVLDVSEDLEEASVYAPISWMKRMSRRVSKPPAVPLRGSTIGGASERAGSVCGASERSSPQGEATQLYSGGGALQSSDSGGEYGRTAVVSVPGSGGMSTYRV